MKTQYKILLIVSLLSNFADNLIGSFYAVFVQNIGGTILDIGYSMTIYSILTGLLIIGIGKISDSVNKKAITVIGFLLFALGNFGYLVVSHSYQLFILQIIFAIGTACLSVPLSSLFATYIQKEHEGMQWALGNGGTKIVIGLSILTGTLIVHSLGFKALFIIMGSLQLVVACLQMTLDTKN